jgi:hypothetical protein
MTQSFLPVFVTPVAQRCSMPIPVSRTGKHTFTSVCVQSWGEASRLTLPSGVNFIALAEKIEQNLSQPLSVTDHFIGHAVLDDQS